MLHGRCGARAVSTIGAIAARMPRSCSTSMPASVVASDLALLSLGVAAVTSERVRKTVGRGIGYVAAGTMTVGGSVVHAGRDIVDEAREVASPNGTAKPAARKKATAAA